MLCPLTVMVARFWRAHRAEATATADTRAPAVSVLIMPTAPLPSRQAG